MHAGATRGARSSLAALVPDCPRPILAVQVNEGTTPDKILDGGPGIVCQPSDATRPLASCRLFGVAFRRVRSLCPTGQPTAGR